MEFGRAQPLMEFGRAEPPMEFNPMSSAPLTLPARERALICAPETDVEYLDYVMAEIQAGTVHPARAWEAMRSTRVHAHYMFINPRCQGDAGGTASRLLAFACKHRDANMAGELAEELFGSMTTPPVVDDATVRSATAWLADAASSAPAKLAAMCAASGNWAAAVSAGFSLEAQSTAVEWLCGACPARRRIAGMVLTAMPAVPPTLCDAVETWLASCGGTDGAELLNGLVCDFPLMFSDAVADLDFQCRLALQAISRKHFCHALLGKPQMLHMLREGGHMQSLFLAVIAVIDAVDGTDTKKDNLENALALLPSVLFLMPEDADAALAQAMQALRDAVKRSYPNMRFLLKKCAVLLGLAFSSSAVIHHHQDFFKSMLQKDGGGMTTGLCMILRCVAFRALE